MLRLFCLRVWQCGAHRHRARQVLHIHIYICICNMPSRAARFYASSELCCSQKRITVYWWNIYVNQRIQTIRNSVQEKKPQRFTRFVCWWGRLRPGRRRNAEQPQSMCTRVQCTGDSRGEILFGLNCDKLETIYLNHNILFDHIFFLILTKPRVFFSQSHIFS